MAGGYDPNNPPIRAGFYSRIQAAAEAAATGGDGGIVAVPIVGNWGPVAEFNRVANQTEYEALYSTTDNDDHFFMVGAFTGNGEVGNGAQELLVYRLDLAGAATAEKDFENDDSDPAINIAAKHQGTRGNDITITFRDDPTDGGNDQMLVYVDGGLVETYTYVEDDLASLVDDANANSEWVSLTLLIDGVVMTFVTGIALDDTAGANGTAVLSDYTDALSLFEAEAFNILAIPDMTDASILAALRTFCEDQNANARRFMIVTGGGSESVSTALTRSALSDDNENVVNMGHNEFIDPNGAARLSSEMVGYVCGMIAGAGAKRSITFDRLPSGFNLSVSPTLDDINAAITGGLLIFSKDANGVKVEKGITTFTDATDPNKPLADFSKIKSVRTIHQIENDLTEVTELEWIGKVVNNDKTRDGYVGMVLSYLRRLEDENILKPGSTVRLDDTQDNTGDTLYPIYGISIAQAIERVLAIGELA